MASTVASGAKRSSGATAGPGQEGREQRAVEPEGMCEGQHTEDDVVRRERHHGPRPRAVGGDQRLVREDRALGPARAARGVEDQGGGVSRRSRMDLIAPLGQCRHHEGRREVAGDARQLGLGEARVQRRHRRAELEASEKRDHEFPPVGQGDRDPIAGANAARGEAPAQREAQRSSSSHVRTPPGQTSAGPRGPGPRDVLDQRREVLSHAHPRDRR